MSNINEINRQALISFFILCVMVIVLAGRLWQVQIMGHGIYYRLAQENAAQSMPVIAPRGVIYDRSGRLLVGNKAVFSVYILQSEIRDKDFVLKKLSSILSMPLEEVQKKISKKTTRLFDPIQIADNIPMDIVSKLEEEKPLLSGVVVNVRPVRTYPNGATAAHVLGYIGEVTSADLDSDRSADLRQGDLIGKAGIEKIYDAYLRGINGGEKVSLKTLGRSSEVRSDEETIPGKNMTLTLDLELQKAAEEALGSNAGAVVILDPSNGEVLTLVSHPSYDPNMFSGPISPDQLKKLYSANHPFLNRALSVYPPGSTFKVVSLSAALESGILGPLDSFICRGFLKIGSRIARCWKSSGHGHITLLEGLVQSCDVVFYNVGLKIGPDLLHDYACKYGLGERTGIDLPGESAGLVPSSDWKKNTYKENWYPGDSMNFAIGQGFLWVTPLQMANLYSALANGKQRFEPHVIMSIKDREGTEVFSYKPKEIGGIPVSRENLDRIKNALHAVVHRATGAAARIATFEAAGKTGTAENPKKPPHAWFICYAPYDKPRIVIASFVEYGQHGDQVTARIAHRLLQWYYDHRVKPPEEPLTEEVIEEIGTE